MGHDCITLFFIAGTVSSRIYIYAVKPPLLRGPQVGEENEVGFAESSNLMQRLMRKGSKQVQKEAETKQAEVSAKCMFFVVFV